MTHTWEGNRSHSIENRSPTCYHLTTTSGKQARIEVSTLVRNVPFLDSLEMSPRSSVAVAAKGGEMRSDTAASSGACGGASPMQDTRFCRSYAVRLQRRAIWQILSFCRCSKN